MLCAFWSRYTTQNFGRLQQFLNLNYLNIERTPISLKNLAILSFKKHTKQKTNYLNPIPKTLFIPCHRALLVFTYQQNSLTIQVFQKQIQKPILTEKNYFFYYLQSNTSTTVLNRLQDLRFMAHMKSPQKTTENLTRKYYQFQ